MNQYLIEDNNTVAIPIETFDIVVVGSGPAGGHCARLLAKSGKKVLLVEQHNNFYKNDFSSAGTPIETLEQFDLPQTVVGSFWKKIIVETTNSSQAWESSKTLGAVLNFAKLREFLASEVEKYGSEVWLGYRYIQYSQNDNQIIVTLKQSSQGQLVKVSTKILVDATGFSRAVMYAKESDKPDFLTSRGIEYLIEVETEVYDRYANSLIFLLGQKWMPKGYSWIFPMEPNKLKVGAGRIYMDRKKISNEKPLKEYVELLINKYIQAEKYKIVDIHGSTLKYSCGLNDVYYRGNVIAIGDAVSTVNCLGGEGIRHGMYCAEIAVKYIIKSLDSQISGFNEYQSEMHRIFATKWNISERLAIKRYIKDSDELTDRAIGYLKYMKAEDIIDILFNYKFEKISKGFGYYFKQKISFLFQRTKAIFRK
ncbi:MAG TPA: NAD(P)/FAD-dependent oxidoreductase [Kamptonema sp.]|nr:NAD(P)/FAD-dependent oxidoreductase [Kamptonema sp.]